MLFTDCREIIPVCTTDVYLVAFGPPFDRALEVFNFEGDVPKLPVTGTFCAIY